MIHILFYFSQLPAFNLLLKESQELTASEINQIHSKRLKVPTEIKGEHTIYL